MNWNDIRYFLTVARLGTLSRAAQTLGVTHVTVGRRIDQLEKAHAVKLFERRQSGYYLTPAGEQLLIEAEQMEHASQNFERQLAGQSRDAVGSLTVSVQENAVLDLSPLLREFIQRYPLVELSIIATPEPLSLNQREADVVLRMIDQPPELLVGRELITIDFLPAASKRYWKKIKKNENTANWIVWQASEKDKAAEHALHNRFPGARTVLRANSYADVLSAVLQDIGIAVLSRPTIDKYSDLVPVSKGPWVSRPLWILTHRDLRSSAKVHALFDFISQHIKTYLS